ncbi:MAG: hypothetical protein AAFY41_10065, partial [Bacteroidota bacterium]
MKKIFLISTSILVLFTIPLHSQGLKELSKEEISFSKINVQDFNEPRFYGVKDFSTNINNRSLSLLADEINVIEFSPNREFYIGYSEEYSQEFLFFNAKGDLIKTIAIPHDLNHPKINFSNDSKAFVIFSPFFNEFFVFDVTGEKLFEGDYTDFVDPKFSLTQILVTGDSQMLLFQLGGGYSKVYDKGGKLLLDVEG